MKKNVQEVESMFSEADYEALKANGASDEELEILRDACAICDNVDMIPENDEKFIDKLNKIFVGKNPGKDVANFFALAEKDPNLFLQIVALFNAYDAYTEDAPAKVEKITLDAIEAQKDAEVEQEVVNYIKEVAEIMNGLSEEDRTAVTEYFKNNNK